jgi:V/A-type H+-transporting ATPase subunit E
MSVQLQELIDRIKKDGVKAAEDRAAEILKEAEASAERIVSEAKESARAVVEKTKAEVRQFEEAGREAIRQAGRDMVLNVKSSLMEIFEAVLSREIKEALSTEVLSEALLSLIKAWGKKRVEDIQLLLSDKQRDEVADYLLRELSEELKRGAEIKPSPNVEAGFRIAEKDGAAFYDFTESGLTEFLMEYLNPKVAGILEGKQD